MPTNNTPKITVNISAAICIDAATATEAIQKALAALDEQAPIATGNWTITSAKHLTRDEWALMAVVTTK